MALSRALANHRAVDGVDLKVRVGTIYQAIGWAAILFSPMPGFRGRGRTVRSGSREESAR